jgi:phosphoribosyl 1,2-cyclic phosphodiesterase
MHTPPPPHAITVIPLQSGSNGNCIYVEAGGVRLVFDAGIGGREARRRLAAFGRDIAGAHALIVSHNHGDHVGSAGVFHRMHGLPLHMTPGTRRVAGYRLGRVSEVRTFKPGATLSFNGIAVHTIPTPHDGVDGVGFIVEWGGRRLGILTDLGHIFDGLPELVESLDAVLIESNYDAEMLDAGSYPWHLKERIRGPGGHISNHESAWLIRAAGRRLQWVCLAHLSAENNKPELARQTHAAVWGDGRPIHVAGRYGACGPFAV